MYIKVLENRVWIWDRRPQVRALLFHLRVYVQEQLVRHGVINYPSSLLLV